jgi:SAM-dependent methyltransferase
MWKPWRRRGLDIEALSRLTQKPELFSESRKLFWTDPHVSAYTLEAHLDPESDAASRPPETIDASVEWIAQLAEARFPREPIHLLDLGCGPGLYTNRFAERGFHVTGVDIAETSIRYARNSAPDAPAGNVRHLLGNYVDQALEQRFHAVTLIYGDFCVLSNGDRNRLLDRLHRLLVPGGVFVFDVFRKSYLSEEQWGPAQDWAVVPDGGFWASEPYLVLERSYEYPEADVSLRRFVIVPERGETKAYNIWRHYYDERTIRRVLEEHGLRVTGLYDDLTGAPLSGTSEWIGVVAEPA